MVLSFFFFIFIFIIKNDSRERPIVTTLPGWVGLYMFYVLCSLFAMPNPLSS
jgi:hypothetical protein